MMPLSKTIAASFNNLPISYKIIAITMVSSLVTLTLLKTILFVRDWTSIVERKKNEHYTC